jgi:glycosyltransferase involved in cell wall biosynthesis
MIVKDGGEYLERCLASARDVFSQIVVVDTGSTDGSRETAKNHGAEVWDYIWWNDFSDARNAAFLKATGDWVMWLDADDTLEGLETLRALDPPDGVNTYRVPLVSGGLVYSRERLFRRSAGPVWTGRVHETCSCPGKVADLDGLVVVHHGQEHDPARNLRIYNEMEASGEDVTARDVFYHARELRDNGLHDAAVWKYRRFLDRSDGWTENRIQAHLDLYVITGDVEYLYNSLKVGPSAAAFRRLGDIASREKRWAEAVPWYRAAINAPHRAGAFEDTDDFAFLPWLGLCVCHWWLGETDKAAKCHRKAKGLKPGHPSVEFNEKYFGGKE